MKAVKIFIGLVVVVILIGVILFYGGIMGSCKACASAGGGCVEYREKLKDKNITATNPLSEAREGRADLKIPTGSCECGHGPTDHMSFSTE